VVVDVGIKSSLKIILTRTSTVRTLSSKVKAENHKT
jgi:hypothetical protein